MLNIGSPKEAVNSRMIMEKVGETTPKIMTILRKTYANKSNMTTTIIGKMRNSTTGMKKVQTEGRIIRTYTRDKRECL